MNGSVYVITNLQNGKQYVGQTIQPVEKRFAQHMRCCKSNSHQAIYKAVKKYGKESFKVKTLVTGISSFKELNALEEYFIKSLGTLRNGYNLCPGGQKYRRKPKLIPTNKVKTIINLYLSGKSGRYIGNALGFDCSVVYKVLDDNGIERRKRSVQLRKEPKKNVNVPLALQMISNGMFKYQVANVLGVNEKTLRRKIKEYNLANEN